MGLLDKLTAKPATTGYDTVGGQAGTALGGQLGEDERALDALAAHRAAQDSVALTPEVNPIVPEVHTIPDRPDDWHPETFLLDPGTVVQVLGRDDHRSEADVTNQTSLENNSGTGTPVYLFRDRNTAQQFVNAVPQPKTGKFAVVPDGAARTFGHTAPVWACIRSDAPGQVVIDVTAERYKDRLR